MVARVEDLEPDYAGLAQRTHVRPVETGKHVIGMFA
jgi:hypothetical protein